MCSWSLLVYVSKWLRLERCDFRHSTTLQYCFSCMKFRAKSEVLLQNNFGQLLPLIQLEIRLFYRKLNSRNRGNSLSVFHRNSPKLSNDQRDKLDWNWLKFYFERNAAFPAITAPRLQTMKQILTTSNTQLNLLTVTFLAILKWTAINQRWLFVDGSAKEAKDWRLPLTFKSEI